MDNFITPPPPPPKPVRMQSRPARVAPTPPTRTSSMPKDVRCVQLRNEDLVDGTPSLPPRPRSLVEQRVCEIERELRRQQQVIIEKRLRAEEEEARKANSSSHLHETTTLQRVSMEMSDDERPIMEEKHVIKEQLNQFVAEESENEHLDDCLEAKENFIENTEEEAVVNELTDNASVDNESDINSEIAPVSEFHIPDDRLIEHLRMRNPELLPRLVKMHLSIMLDLDGDCFANIFDEAQPVEESRKFGTIKKRKHDTRAPEKPIFQQALTEEGICRMYLLIDFIGQESNITQEGLFRKSGSNARQQELKFKLQNRMDVILENGGYTVHDCANVLKTCLSELPEPLLSELYYRIICKCGSLCPRASEKASAKTLKIVQLTLLLLPIRKLRFAHDLLLLLHRVSSKENADNKMNARNLATLFAPHLLCPKKIAPTQMQQWLVPMTDLLEYMIQETTAIFLPPVELLLDVRRELHRLNQASSSTKEENVDDAVHTAYTFCDREAAPAEKYTEQHVAELYAYIQTMPETPSKKKLIKQFNRQNGGLTPQPDKENASKKKGASIKSIGNRLKNAKNLFKATTTKNLLSANRKECSSNSTLDDARSSEGMSRSNSREDFLDMPGTSSSVADVPIADLTVTKFCIEDEDFDDEEESLLEKKSSKKARMLDSKEDILIDTPYTSESIIV